jgi:predicted homoserine dehydrogenase-like protein
MNLSTMLSSRVQNDRPVRVGLIGAGKFGSMILSQAQHIKGLHITAVADLDLKKAQDSFQRVGWDIKNCFAGSASEAVISGKTWLTDNAVDICALSELDCIIEATGHPLFGVRHAMMAIEQAKHVVMVNVEADVLCGPYLTQRATENNVIFSMAYGDQPAAICELVDWVRTNGFELISAGKGMNFQPHFRYSTPDTVWGYFGWSDEQVAAGDFNPKMYNSFTDGTKAAIEMAAVANATGLHCPDDGLAFYPAGLHDLAAVFKPESEGGRLPKAGLLTSLQAVSLMDVLFIIILIMVCL